MKKISVLGVIFCIGCMVFAGCGSGDDTVTGDRVETNTEVEVSEEVSEEQIVEVSEESTEEVSEEVVIDETEYTFQSLQAVIDEITVAYPNEEPRQIAAVAVGTNAKYMAEEELEIALSTYDLTKEEVNELFIQYFETKGDV